MNWKKILLIAVVAVGFAFAAAPRSEARVFVNVGLGFPGFYYGPGPYYGYGYAPYGYYYGGPRYYYNGRPYYWYRGQRVYYSRRPYRHVR
jgi:hypothetical protein